MRLSVEKDDPGFGPWEETRIAQQHVSVFLGGVELRDCITVDDEAGMVLRYKSDEAGKPVMDGDEWATETLHGVVRIVLTPRAN